MTRRTRRPLVLTATVGALVAPTVAAGCSAISLERTSSVDESTLTAVSLGPVTTWDPQRMTSRKDMAFAGRVFLRTLTAFLKANPDPTMETRNHRETIEQAIGEELAMFGVAIRGSYPAGWTRDEACQLPLCEQLWLDPDRFELPERNDPGHPHWQEDDLAFNQAYEHGDWADEVAVRFGRWLNGQLRKRSDKLALLGEAEMYHFASHAILDVAWPTPTQRRAKSGAA